MHSDAPPEDALRALLARDIHDRIGSGLALALRRLELLEATSVGLTQQEQERLAAVRSALMDTLVVTRDVTAQLRRARRAPTAASLADALDAFVRSMEPLGPKLDVQIDGDDSWLSQHLVTEVFLVVREALRNVLAHARAAHAAVHVVIDAHDIHASVTDDGTGFNAAPELPGHTDGLLGMRERARALGGLTTVTSVPGRGTRVTVWIPITESSIRHG